MECHYDPNMCSIHFCTICFEERKEKNLMCPSEECKSKILPVELKRQNHWFLKELN